MKWHKLGLIFCPDKNYDWMVSHASLPIAEHIEGDVYRIYFSCRDRNNRSCVGFIEIDIRNINRILEISDKPVLQPGEIGLFDDNGAMGSWIVTKDTVKYLYYIGWQLGVTIPFRNYVGLAVSYDNGKSFEKISNTPILDRDTVDPFFCASASVIADSENFWKMWYVSCIKWAIENGQPKHYYHIKYAESSDGKNWHRDGIVAINFKNTDEYAISRPCVLKDSDIYKMWYSYRGKAYRIGYAESKDGINWTRQDEKAGIDISPSGWDSEMIEYPYIFDHKGERYMLYNGNSYGKTGFGLAVLEEK